MSKSKKTPPPRPPPPPPPPPADQTAAENLRQHEARSPRPSLPLEPALETMVKAFAGFFTAHNAAYQFEQGQFSVPSAMLDPLRAQIYGINNTALREELLSLIRGSAWDALLGDLNKAGITTSKGIVKADRNVQNTSAYRTNTTRARELMAAFNVSPADRAIAKAVLDDASATGAWAESAINQWLGAKTLGPRVFDKVTLPRLAATWIDSFVMCGSTADSTAKQFLDARGPGAPIPAFPTVVFATATQHDTKPRSVPGNRILSYTPAALASVLQKARTVLSPPASGFLVAGVLSGKDYEATQHPFPEHYILLFAQSGNQFLFWDPAVDDTVIYDLRNKLAPGIGILYYDTVSDPAKPTFSTGYNFEDLKKVDDTGHHVDYGVRKRYQVAQLVKP